MQMHFMEYIFQRMDAATRRTGTIVKYVRVINVAGLSVNRLSPRFVLRDSVPRTALHLRKPSRDPSPDLSRTLALTLTLTLSLAAPAGRRRRTTRSSRRSTRSSSARSST